MISWPSQPGYPADPGTQLTLRPCKQALRFNDGERRQGLFFQNQILRSFAKILKS